MDGDRAAGGPSGPCRECGVRLPAATQRYCVNCGAEVSPAEEPSWFASPVEGSFDGSFGAAFDSAFDSSATIRSPLGPPSRPGGVRRPTTWSSGDFRAPAPTDGEGLRLEAELEPPPGVEWNGPVDERPEPEPGPVPEPAREVATDAGPPATPGPTATPGPPATPGPTDEADAPFTWPADLARMEEMLPFAPHRPMAAGPIRLEIAHPPDPAPADDTDGRGYRLRDAAARPAPGSPTHLPGFPPPAPVVGPEGFAPRAAAPGGGAPGAADGTASDWPALGWPAAPQRPVDLDAGAPPGRFPPPALPAAAPRRGRAMPIAIAVAGVVLVAATAGTVWWLRSRGPAEQLAAANPVSAPVRPAGSSSEATSASAGPAGASGTAATAADATPGASASASAAPTDLPSATSVAAFATALDGLLGESAAARSNVSATVAALGVCRTDPGRAATTLRSAGRARTALAERGGAVASAGVPGGADVVAAFVAMQRASASADDSFAAWADDVVRSGCRTSAPHTAHWAEGNQHSGEATAAKSRFVGLWNPIAAANGKPGRSTDGI